MFPFYDVVDFQTENTALSVDCEKRQVHAAGQSLWWAMSVYTHDRVASGKFQDRGDAQLTPVPEVLPGTALRVCSVGFGRLIFDLAHRLYSFCSWKTNPEDIFFYSCY